MFLIYILAFHNILTIKHFHFIYTIFLIDKPSLAIGFPDVSHYLCRKMKFV